MATGSPPWSQYSNPVTAMYHIACVDSIPPFPSQLSVRGHNFLQACLNRKPEKRWDTTRLLLHPFVIYKEETMIRPDSAMVLRPLTAGTNRGHFSRGRDISTSPTFSRTMRPKIRQTENNAEGEVFIQNEEAEIVEQNQASATQMWTSRSPFDESEGIDSYGGGEGDLRPISPDVSVKFPEGTYRERERRRKVLQFLHPSTFT